MLQGQVIANGKDRGPATDTLMAEVSNRLACGSLRVSAALDLRWAQWVRSLDLPSLGVTPVTRRWWCSLTACENALDPDTVNETSQH